MNLLRGVLTRRLLKDVLYQNRRVKQDWESWGIQERGIPITLVQGKGMLWVIRKRAPKRCARGPGSNIPGWAKETKIVGGTFLEKKKKKRTIYPCWCLCRKYFAYAENTLATWCKEPTHWNRPWCWGRLKAEEKGAEKDELFRWHHWLNGHEFEQTLGDSGGQRSLACCSPWGQNELETT